MWVMARKRTGQALVATACALGVLVWAALSGAATRSSTTTIEGGQTGSTQVRCRQARRVVGVDARGESGFSFSGPVVVLGEISRPGRRRARAAGQNFGMSEGQLTAVARCRRGPRSRLQSETITIPPASADVETQTVAASCPRGRRLVFGGFRAEQRPQGDPDNPIVIPTAAKRTGPRTWRVEGFNFADGPDDAGELSALAYCGKAKRTTAKVGTRSIDPLESQSATARCPRGTRVRYGGFQAETQPNGALLITGLARTGRRTFRATAFALSMLPLELTAIAYCR
jgi:hypothetical protein